MKLLIDECVPKKFKKHLDQHECQTVPEMGLAGRKNGELLTLAEQSGFEVFLSLDHGIEFEQNWRQRKIAVILLRAKSNRLADLLNHVPKINKALDSIKHGQVVHIG